MNKGRLIVISGPSGTGKGTICKRLGGRGDLALSISMTTRAPRPGETEGVSYYFVDDRRFDEFVAEDGFLEHAAVYGHRYGTPRGNVMKELAKGRDVILEIDVQGAMQVRKNCGEGVYVYILPPTIEELRKRIVARGSESGHDIDLRLDKALDEIKSLSEYDYCVVNNDLDEAVHDVAAIIRAERLRIFDVPGIMSRYGAE